MLLGGVEAGGTKWTCAVGSSPEEVHACESHPTTTPHETIARTIDFFRRNGAESLVAIGIGSFGPVDLCRVSNTFGWIMNTPKPHWQNVDVVAPLATALAVPVAFDTDVNIAALGEHRSGAAVDVSNLLYITAGTGIGGGALVNGQLVHGRMHPEFGHILIPHDCTKDPFAGICPFHGDCLEGLASGEALRVRYGVRSECLTDESAWEREAQYLALGIVNALVVLSPERVVLAGGVTKRPGLLARVSTEVVKIASGYLDGGRPFDADGFIVAPVHGDRSGVIGALELAQQIAIGSRSDRR